MQKSAVLNLDQRLGHNKYINFISVQINVGKRIWNTEPESVRDVLDRVKLALIIRVMQERSQVKLLWHEWGQIISQMFFWNFSPKSWILTIDTLNWIFEIVFSIVCGRNQSSRYLSHICLKNIFQMFLRIFLKKIDLEQLS